MSTRRRSSLLIPSFPLPALPLPESPELPRQPPRIIQDDLEDAPPPSILHARTAPEHSPDPPRDSTDLSRDQLQPEPRIPSSRRTLTRALELAREAVQLDSTNEEPQAVVMAYGRSVALLSEVMERVRRGEDSTDPSSPRHKGRPRSAVAQEEEVRRLQNIHDTYVDRMNILSAIYNIPPVPYSTTNEYIQITSQSDQQQAQASSPTGFLSPTSDRSDPIPTSDAYTAPYPDEHEQDPGHDRDPTTEADMFPFDPSRSGLPPVSYPYPAAQYEEPPAPAPRPRRPRNTPAAALALPSPPPANSLPPPPLYEPASLATSIIYWPDDTTGVSDLETDFAPKPTAGLEKFMRDHPNGGAFVSVHQPSKPLAWLEHNYDLPLLEHIRKTGVLSGPIPMQLFPEVSALGIFGPHRDPKTAELAQALANISKFPVIARPSANDPMLRFQTTVATEKSGGLEKSFSTAPIVVMNAQIDGGNGAAGGNRRGLPSGGGNDPDGRGHGHGPPAGGEDPEGPPGDGGNDPDYNEDGGGGGGDPDGEGTGTGVDDDNWADWASPVHRAKLAVNMDFRVSNSAAEKFTVPMEIICRTQFKTHGTKNVVLHPKQKEEEKAADEPQAEVHTILKVQFKPDRVALETSFTVLGFLSNRPRSIFDSTDLDVGFSEPGRIIKHVSGQTRGHNFGVTGGIAGGYSPTALINYQYNRGTNEAVEALDDKVAQPVKVSPQMGESCELDGRSYASCNFSYEARLDPMTGKKISVPSLSVGFAFGTHFWNTDVEGIPVHPPQVSSVNRHQIFIWVFDPQSKIPIQGFVLVFSTMVSDIRRKGQIEWDASLKIDIESGIASELEGGRKPHEDTSFFVGIVPMPQSGDKHVSFQSIQQRLKGLFNRDKSPRLNPPPPVTLTPQPITSIGWDSKYAQWRDPVYPKLDKKFRPLEQGDASLVAYAIGSFPKEKEED